MSPSRIAAALLALGIAGPLAAQDKRPLTFLDVQNMRTVGSPAVSPDGRLMLYTLSTPDWSAARRQSDIYLVSTERGIASTRQLTFTKDKNETSPKWSRDGSFFAFLSDRDAPPVGAASGGRGAASADDSTSRNQLYLMRVDGGEARKITDARDGVTSFAFTRDGKYLVYSSGRPDNSQLYAFAVGDLFSGEPNAVQWTHHATGMGDWQLSQDGKHVIFATPDSVDRDDRVRRQRGFTVRPRTVASSLHSLWVFDVESRQERRLTDDSSYSVGDFTISPDGRWVGYHGLSANRYRRGNLEQLDDADLYLADVSTGKVERLTNNVDIAEGSVVFSPDSRTIAFSAPDDFTFMHNERVYVRPVDQPAAKWRKLGSDFDGDVRVGSNRFAADGLSNSFFSRRGDTIYFNAGVRATTQFMAVDVASGRVKQLTHERAALSVSQDEETGKLFVSYADPTTPSALFAVASTADAANRGSWVRLTRANPALDSVALGDEEEITWKSADGQPVSGVLVRPVGYRSGQKYPLIVAIHGGPAAADVLGFNGGYNAQVYAGAGYVVLEPNYRQSTNYGQKFKIESQGDYFTKGFQDIMSGVDYLIAQGIVDSTRMGALGWSAGGHYSNWIEGHTTRFKAISSGAGVANWISMWGQSDTHRLRQWYVGDKMYYDGDFMNWWRQSPIAYIKNAKTPMFIHVVDGDPRVPRPQSEEMHQALIHLGVPVEFWVYPGNTHGIPDARNQYLKAVAEMSWMDYWVRGSGTRFQWRDVLKSVQSENGPALAGESRP